MRDYYDILFDRDDRVCWGGTVYDTSSIAVIDGLIANRDKLPFICINPLTGPRNDSNVAKYRSILVEFDTGSISEQLAQLKQSGLPYSTLVYSGGKSLHAIVSMATPFETSTEYRNIARAIYKKLPGCDAKVLNPSRFSRTPGALREGKEQTLLETHDRISNATLLNWLGPIEHADGPIKLPQELWGCKLLPARVRFFLKNGAPPGERNSQLFYNACEMFRAGFVEEEIYDMVSSSPLDLPDHEIRTCIRSARKASNAG